MKVLELFAGTRSIGKAFERKGHDVVSVDYDESFKDVIHTDAYNYLMVKGEEFDVIWASPCCTTYSIARNGYHRTWNDDGRQTRPKTDYAKLCDRNNAFLFKWFDNHRNMIWFIENPRGQMQHMDFAQCLADLKTCLCYCQYGYPTMKPTNIWTSIKDPGWRPMCHPGAEHHPKDQYAFEKIFRRYKRGTIPDELCDYIVELCERTMKERSSNDQRTQDMYKTE